MFSPKMTTTCLIGVCVDAVSAKPGLASEARMTLVVRAANLVPQVLQYLIGAVFCLCLPCVCMFPCEQCARPLFASDNAARHQPRITAGEWRVSVEGSPPRLQFCAGFMSICRHCTTASLS